MGTAAKAAVLAVVAVVTFAAATVVLSGGDDPAPAGSADTAAEPNAAAPAATAEGTGETAEPTCRDPAQDDPAYQVEVTSEPDPPRAEGTTFWLTVTRDGEPVTDALVCLVADMSDMAHEGVVAPATETAPGTYELSTGFVMRGGWDGQVRVVAQDGSAVRVDLPLNVE